MRFQEDVKSMLSRREPEEFASAEAELYGFLQAGAVLVMKGGGEVNLRFETEHAFVARHLYKLIKTVFGFCPELSRVVRSQFGTSLFYAVLVRDSAFCKEMLQYYQIGELSQGFGAAQEIEGNYLREEESRRAYLTGVFLACGYVADPKKSYLLEFTLHSEGYAQAFQNFLLTMGLHAQLREKKGEHVLYIKKSEEISAFLAMCGAFEGVMRLEDRMAMKDMKNRLQRVVNCETANMNKTIESALLQTQAIEKIMREKGLSSLPDYLLEAANLRLENPDSSLSEMAKLASPPISRSTLDKRLRKIVQIAQELG